MTNAENIKPKDFWWQLHSPQKTKKGGKKKTKEPYSNYSLESIKDT
jgi:hypothetical protein